MSRPFNAEVKLMNAPGTKGFLFPHNLFSRAFAPFHYLVHHHWGIMSAFLFTSLCREHHNVEIECGCRGELWKWNSWKSIDLPQHGTQSFVIAVCWHDVQDPLLWLYDPTADILNHVEHCLHLLQPIIIIYLPPPPPFHFENIYFPVFQSTIYYILLYTFQNKTFLSSLNKQTCCDGDVRFVKKDSFESVELVHKFTEWFIHALDWSVIHSKRVLSQWLTIYSIS